MTQLDVKVGEHAAFVISVERAIGGL